MEDRRTAPRIPLDAPCLLTLLVNGEKELPAMVVDVSRGGVQLALPLSLPAAPDPAEFATGMSATLKDVSVPLSDLLEGVHGKVAWFGDRCCGIRLNKELPIDAADITDLARL